MSGLRFTLKQTPRLRVDMRGITPSVCEGLALPEIERRQVTHGVEALPLAEFFHIACTDDEGWVFDADLARFDRVGWQMASGRVVVLGAVGDYAGGCMSGGELQVNGAAGALAACEMSGGRLVVEGSVGDFAASTLPGSMDGMRGGTLVVKGNAGARFGDRMRRGSALVFGDAGDFLASRMVAGTIAVGSAAGAHVGYAMRRGSVVFAGSAPVVSPTFVPALAEAGVIWQLLARDLARHGGPFAQLAKRRPVRHLGDLAADGKGELIVTG
jgi:formylmethanofuran dehydrogenase subunit C